MLQNVNKLIKIQLHELRGHAGGEHPLRASSWKEASWEETAELCHGRFRCDGCMHGLKNPETQRPLQKSWGWFSSDSRIRDVLEKKCNHPPEAHDIVEGKLTPMTASYPEALCTVFAKVLMSPTQIWSEWEDSCAYLTKDTRGHYCATCLATSHSTDATQNLSLIHI